MERQHLWSISGVGVLEIRRGRVRKAASFSSKGNRSATVCFGKSIAFVKRTYLNGDLRRWRVLLPSGSDVLAGFMRSPESAHFS